MPKIGTLDISKPRALDSPNSGAVELEVNAEVLDEPTTGALDAPNPEALDPSNARGLGDPKADVGHTERGGSMQKVNVESLEASDIGALDVPNSGELEDPMSDAEVDSEIAGVELLVSARLLDESRTGTLNALDVGLELTISVGIIEDDP